MATSTKKILVATDFSAGSDEALAHAIDLAKQTGASLDLVHILEPEVEGFPFGAPYYGDFGDQLTFIDRELAARADKVASAGLWCHTRMIEGRAFEAIVDRARVLGADLIVVGTHGRTGLSHVLMGSVAERVVQHSTCPVLTIPFSKRAA
jgi:glycine betaine transporter